MEYVGRRNGQNYLEPTGAGFTEHHCSILSWRRAPSPDLVLLQFGNGAEFAHLKRTTCRRPHALQVSGSRTPHEIHTHPHDLGSNLSEEDLNRLRIMYPDRYRSQGARQAWRSPDGLPERAHYGPEQRTTNPETTRVLVHADEPEYPFVSTPHGNRKPYG